MEAIEHTYPFRVGCYGIRSGSGGAGKHCGGDGIVREICLLAPATVSLLSERRTFGPFGLRGGQAGMTGCNTLIGSDGEERELAGKGTWQMQCGDAIRLETPGGGGWGEETMG